jgi:uncharacterized membrane protein YgcG
VLRAALVLLAVAAGPAAPPAAAAAEPRGFSIERLAVTVDVRRDASLAVQEAITVDFRGPHQGLYRVIPIRYSRGGFDFALRVDHVQVLDEESRPLRTEVSYSGRYVRIKAWVPGPGDARRTVRLLYRVRRGLFSVDDHEELYWNATGDEWDVPIAHAEATVISPSAIPLDQIRSVAYTGYRGTAGTDYQEERSGRVLSFRTTRPLRPREGLTVAVAWPAGSIGRPPAWRSAAWFLQDNWPVGLPVLTLVLGLLAWRRYGRDPMTGLSIKPEYQPPADLSPAEAGALVSERAHPSDVVATLVDLAVRGYMQIEPVTRADDEPDFLFRRLRPILGDPEIRPFELFVLAKIFDTDWTLNMRLLSEVRRDYDNVFPPVRDELYRTMVRRRLFPVSPEHVRGIWRALGLLALAAGGLLYVWPPDWAAGRAGVVGLGVGLSGIVIAAFSPFMPRRTWDGARATARVRGFQEFLERVEKDRLERMPHDTLHRWLGWAIALGITERWIWKFEGLPVDKPTWYRGPDGFSLGDYHRAVRSFSQRTEEAILTTRRDGGAGGWSGGSGMSRGSSGGGLGGGGGGAF